MAFDVNGLDINSGGAKGGVNIHTYKSSADTLATITASGYFSTFGTAIQSNDLLYAQGSDASGMFVLTNTSNVITATAYRGDKVYLQGRIADISTAETIYFVSPVAGKVTSIRSVISAAITVADATLTSKIGTTAITGGAITVATAGSAAGTVDSATPTAANTVAAGDYLTIATDGGSTTTSVCTVVIEISPA